MFQLDMDGFLMAVTGATPCCGRVLPSESALPRRPFSTLEAIVNQPTAVLFYVVDIARSSRFYSDLFNLKPAVASPFYVMFKLENGFEIAIYDRKKLHPQAGAMSSSAELCFVVADRSALEELHEQWVQKGIEIIMPPTKMYFGGVHFMGLDPDGHRLRVGTPD